jgi:hypothetical protein
VSLRRWSVVALVAGVIAAVGPGTARAGAVITIDGVLDSKLGRAPDDLIVVRTDIMKYTIRLRTLNPQQQEAIRAVRPEQRVSVTVAFEKIERMTYIEGALAH